MIGLLPFLIYVAVEHVSNKYNMAFIKLFGLKSPSEMDSTLIWKLEIIK